MAETKGPETKKKDPHAKSTYFQSQEYLVEQSWRGQFRDAVEAGGMSHPMIKKYCNDHKYQTKSDYSGIILRKRGWITAQIGYKSVICCGKYDTDNSAGNWALICAILVVLWIFYALFMIVTLTLFNTYGHSFLWFGSICQTLNFILIMTVVVAGYAADNAAYKDAMEAAKREAEAEEGKMDKRL